MPTTAERTYNLRVDWTSPLSPLTSIDHRLVLEGEAGRSDKGGHEPKLYPVLLQELVLVAVPHLNDGTVKGETKSYQLTGYMEELWEWCPAHP